MIPIIFESNETAFTSNGLGRLPDATRCEVTEERNGMYELAMDYPVSGRNYDLLQTGRFIFATHDESRVPQPFEIYSTSAPLEGLIEVHAWHISYKLNNIILKPFTANSCSAAMAAIPSNIIGSSNFTFWTNKSVSASFKLKVPAPVRSVLGGMEGSILDTFGTAEYEFDKWAVKLHAARGVNAGVSLRYGKNLLSLDQALSAANQYDSILPFWASEETVVYSPTAVTRSGGTTNKTVVMDFSDQFEEAPTVAQLQAKAQSMIDSTSNYTIAENIKVNFVALWQTEDYKNYASLERIKLCDVVNIYYEKLGINATAKCIRVVYDTLRDRYISLELGEPQTTLAQQIQQNIETNVTANFPTQGDVAAAIARATELLTGADGGYHVQIMDADGHPTEDLWMDTDDVNTATYVLRINRNGIGFSTSGVQGPYTSAWLIDGSFNADFITAGTLSADRIASGSITVGKLAQAVQDDIAAGVAADEKADTAQSAAEAAQTAADGANAREQLIYRSRPSGTTTLSKPSAWITDTTGSQNVWTTKRPAYSQSYPVLFVATQRQSVDGTLSCTTPLIDDTTTIIDGGNIITGSITANQIAAGSLTIGNLNTAAQEAIAEGQDALEKANANTDTLNNLTGYIKADNGVLTLGKAGNAFTTELDNTKLAFKQDGEDVAYVSNSKLFITEAQILTNLQIGHYQWITDSTGRMSLKWVE